MIGPCAKTTVRCTLITPSGGRIVGENWCANPQPACPRTAGEGYEKCKSICQQEGHAEAVAVRLAGERAQGARAYIEGHTYACQNCQETLFAAGVDSLTIGAPPAQGERWFAWYPVVLEDGTVRWLTMVERVWKDDLHVVGDMSGYTFPEGGWIYRSYF